MRYPSAMTNAVGLMLATYVGNLGAAPLRITSPAAGTQAAPGSTVNVIVEPEAGISVGFVLVASIAGVNKISAAPYQTSIVVPAHHTGEFRINVSGRTPAGVAITGETIAINVVPADAPQRLTAALDSRLSYLPIHRKRARSP